MRAIIQTPEFWTSIAFILAVVFAVRPIARLLIAWGQKQAEQIRKNQQAAHDVLEKAEALRDQYNAAYQNRYAERRKLMAEADSEIEFLETETQQRMQDRMAHKTQEVELRLKMIEENGRQDIKGKMLTRVVGEAKRSLERRRDSGAQNENTNELVKRAFEALEMHAAT